MVRLPCPLVSAGMVAGECGAQSSLPPAGRRSPFDPCMPGWCGACRLVCSLSVVALTFLQRFVWWLVVSAASWSACSLLGLFCCSRWSSMWSYQSVLCVDVVVLPDVVVCVL